ncbi:hypothetical protein FRB91_009042 [Serendipita sp. 411]|nr:hypothetical protein FRB91_009042 [Serendipita sp. 411]
MQVSKRVYSLSYLVPLKFVFRERSSSRTQRYEVVVDKLMLWKPVKDATDLCSFVSLEHGLEPPEIFRHDSALGWMKRVVFCVPISYLPCNQQGVPKILEQSFSLCARILQKSNWDEQEAAHFASTPKLSASRFEEVIIAVERDDSDLAMTVRSIPEALGLMNYLFFSLPRPLLQLSSTLIGDPDLCRSWWESSRDNRKVSDLFRSETLDRVSECTLRFLLEGISGILPHARNLHIVDVAMAWAKPLFQNPRPTNAEITALCVLFRQALLLHRHDQDERWHTLWSKSSLQRTGTLMMGSSSNSSGTLTHQHSRQPTILSKSITSSPVSRRSPLSRNGTISKMI